MGTGMGGEGRVVLGEVLRPKICLGAYTEKNIGWGWSAMGWLWDTGC